MWKKKTKKALKNAAEEAISGSTDSETEDIIDSETEDTSDNETEVASGSINSGETKDYEGYVLDELYRFSGHWRGFYRQFGENHNVECMLIFDQNGIMAGKGCDISNYTISGKIKSNGSFKFYKQYIGPTCTHQVVYTGTVEWGTQPILQGK